MSRPTTAVVVGAGMVGCATALVLAQAGIRVQLLDRQRPDTRFAAQSYDQRVSAISPLSQSLLTSLGAWPLLYPQRVAPYTAMQVWDQSDQDGVFMDVRQTGQSELGHIVENRHLQLSLLQCVDAHEFIELHTIEGLEALEFDQRWVVLLRGQAALEADLLVAADGARSVVREYLGIGVQGASYEQQGLVVNVRCQQAHQQVARQRFLHTGPLAFLPLPHARECSIVWSCTDERAAELMAMEETHFCAALQQGISNQLGAVELRSERAAFPLRWQMAERFVATQALLVGDAAHAVHPLAGQGVNQGFSDVLKLQQLLQQGRSLLQPLTLSAYQRGRKTESRLAMQTFSALNWLYAQQHPMFSALRNAGMRWVDSSPLLKRQMMFSAMRNLAGVK